MKCKFPNFSVLLGGLTGALLVCLLVAAICYRAGLDDLSRRLTVANTRLGEKLAQHEAHLTAFAAVVRMEEGPQSENVKLLAEAVSSFYPRITEIATIHVKGSSAAKTRFDRSDVSATDEQNADELPVLATPGSTVARSEANDLHQYAIYKLLAPNYYLAMKIDAAGLVDDELLPSDYGYQLWLGDTLLYRRSPDAPALLIASRSLDSNSASQPLRLEMSRGFAVTELLPPVIVLPVILAIAGTLFLFVEYRRAVQAERHQKRRAALLEQEAKLVHAGRVNALGEMASGIAHELAQPVAALLSQSQAARRAMTLERQQTLEQALDANVREAKRAGDILARMRAYISGGASQLETIPLKRALTEAMLLAEPDLTRRGIALDIVVDDGDRLLRIDVIAFQQVLHNILRNSAEALDGRSDPLILIKAGVSDKQAVFSVTDNGPGIPVAALPRIFEPFFTTKPDGMGLGLPLCARLVEKMDGSVEAINNDGACFIIRLPLETVQ